MSSAAVPIGFDVNRPSADYHSSVWGDYFLSYCSNHQSLATDDDMIRHQNLKEEVRSMLTGCSKISQTLEMVDEVQRLGINYHFQTEIDEILKEMMNKTEFSLDDDNDDDLYVTSLKFRLLRQQGYNISCDVFDKFKDGNSKFKDEIVNDVRGMLSLYEATHVRTQGDKILDRALPFTIAHLQTMATQLSSPLSDQINHALNRPYHMGIPRLEARNHLRFYERNASCNKVILSFAKLDYNLLQKKHQKELGDITRWWKKLDFGNKLPFTRNRVVESYFWALGMYFEPEYLMARRMVTKVTTIALVIDDIFDAVGTAQELELFTAAIERWDISEIDKLPKYIKEVFKALIDVYSEIEETMVNEGNSYRSYYAKEAMKKMVRANFAHSKWLHQKYIPTMEEYVPMGIPSSGYPLLATTSQLGMGDVVTKHTFEWLFNDPKIVAISSMMGRFMDDIADLKLDQQTDHTYSCIDSYMKQYDCTEEEAVEEFKKGIKNAWKDINGEFMQSASVIPLPVLIRLLNIDRVVDVMYKNEDYFTNVGGAMKDLVSSLLVDPVPM